MTVQSSPLTSQVPAGTTRIYIEPLFGGQLQVSFQQKGGPAVDMNGTVTGLTVHGDGRIEYHQKIEEHER